jgi:hypothetical protein
MRLLALVFPFALLSIGCCCAGAKKGMSGSSGGSVAKSTVTVDAKTLLKDYKDNEVRADGLYKGKIVQTTGKIGDIKKDIMDSVYVTVGTGASIEIPIVQCFVDAAGAAKASSLKKGATITVKGEVQGLMMNVQMHDCSIL